MREKHIFYTELAYLIGVLALAFGTAIMERADFGMSMIVAPAYLLHLKLSPALPFFTFGVAEYVLQTFVLIALAIVLRKVKLKFFFSFCTALFYGTLLDLFMVMISDVTVQTPLQRILAFVVGMAICCAGVSLLFHTYISPEAYELFVKEIAETTGYNINKTKTIYDCTSCLVAIVMSFLFFGFGHFEGIKWGTIICALSNGATIALFSRLFNAYFRFEDRLQLRRVFE